MLKAAHLLVKCTRCVSARTEPIIEATAMRVVLIGICIVEKGGETMSGEMSSGHDAMHECLSPIYPLRCLLSTSALLRHNSIRGLVVHGPGVLVDTFVDAASTCDLNPGTQTVPRNMVYDDHEDVYVNDVLSSPQGT